MTTAFELSGKHILVTGASSGFGRAISIACSRAGACVSVTGRNMERLSETLEMLDGDGHNLYQCDITSGEDLKSLVGQLPILDGVVFCAGILKTTPVRFVSEEETRSIFDTNVIAQIALTKQLLAARKINAGASLVYISSIATRQAAPGNAVYAASKGAISSFVKVVALEQARMKVRANCILPGFVRTGISDTDMVSEEDLQKIKNEYPLGEGYPEDIANGTVFLLSSASRWITGAELVIDGGITLK